MLDHRIIIIGAGGFGQELAEYVCDCFNLDINFPKEIILLDDFLDKDFKSENWLFGGRLSDFKPQSTDRFLIGIGSPQERSKIAKYLSERGLELFTLVHPTAYVSKNSIIGKGSIISPNCTIGYGSSIEENVLINTYSAIGHHAKIGSHSVISPKVLLSGYVELEERVFVGAGAVITPSKRIANGAIIGAGSVVYRNVKSEKKVLGNPARNRLN